MRLGNVEVSLYIHIHIATLPATHQRRLGSIAEVVAEQTSFSKQ